MRALRGPTNVMVRAATLGLRFVLVFYIAKYLGYRDAGVYGLVIGAVGITPALIGWGLNYFVAREVVGIEPSRALLIIRDRLLITFLSLLAGSVIAFAASVIFSIKIDITFALIIALVWLETITLDIHIAMIGMERALLANILMFVRSALWVVPAVLLGLIDAHFRNLDSVFGMWIGGHAVGAAILWYAAKQIPAEGLGTRPVDVGWIKKKLRHSWLIYLSDLGLVGFIYIDRYIVSLLLGLSDTGIYTFYWSLTNALQTLVATAVVQLALPELVKAHRFGSVHEWRTALIRQLTKTLLLSVSLSVLMFFASGFVLHFMALPGGKDYGWLFILLLAASVLRSCSDVLNVGLSSTRSDGPYAAINILGVVLSVALALVFISALGLIGAGVSACVAAFSLVAVRALFLVKQWRAAPLNVPAE